MMNLPYPPGTAQGSRERGPRGNVLLASSGVENFPAHWGRVHPPPRALLPRVNGSGCFEEARQGMAGSHDENPQRSFEPVTRLHKPGLSRK